MRKHEEQNDSISGTMCAWVHIGLYFDLPYKYSKIYSKNEISKATEDREGECYRRETRWRNATFTGVMTILSQDSAITKAKFVYLFGDRIYNRISRIINLAQLQFVWYSLRDT
jgi:hypothetical protein